MCRKIYGEVVGPWTRDTPFDFTLTTSLLELVERRRKNATHLVSVLDRALVSSRLGDMPIAHFPAFATSSPTDRVQTGTIAAMRSLRMAIHVAWSYPALILYSNLKALRDKLTEQSSNGQLDARTERHVDFCLAEARALAWQGFEAILDSFARLASLAVWTHSLPNGFDRWAEFALGEVERGTVVVDAKVAGQLEALSSALKQTGYVWSNAKLDTLIFALDSHAVEYRLATNTAARHETRACRPPRQQGCAPGESSFSTGAAFPPSTTPNSADRDYDTFDATSMMSHHIVPPDSGPSVERSTPTGWSLGAFDAPLSLFDSATWTHNLDGRPAQHATSSSLVQPRPADSTSGFVDPIHDSTSSFLAASCRSAPLPSSTASTVAGPISLRSVSDELNEVLGLYPV
ncbi:hypothetical protein JCM10212_003809 [Sporobolomyces blumeae]